MVEIGTALLLMPAAFIVFTLAGTTGTFPTLQDQIFFDLALAILVLGALGIISLAARPLIRLIRRRRSQ